MRKWIAGMVAGVVLGTALSLSAQQVGPFSAQIQRALNAFRANGTFTNLTVTGTCTGCAGTPANPTLFADGTSGAPSIAFASEPTLGFWRVSAGVLGINSTAGGMSIQGNSWNVGSVNAGLRSAQTGAKFVPSITNDGWLYQQNNANTIGILTKVDALPTVASGFGTGPAITAGSTPFAGSINVGTGAPGTGGVITFNGTAFPSAPFVVCNDDSSLLLVRCTATTTQLTITATALTASDIVSWIAVSSK